MVGITFEPYGPLTECVNIAIDRDFLVEDTESFKFFIDPYQEDEALIVGDQDYADIIILDEAEGNQFPLGNC